MAGIFDGLDERNRNELELEQAKAWDLRTMLSRCGVVELFGTPVHLLGDQELALVQRWLGAMLRRERDPDYVRVSRVDLELLTKG